MLFDRPMGTATARLRRTLGICAVFATLAPIRLAAQSAGSSTAASAAIPERLDDHTFWSLVTSISEPGGSFRSDNFVSNELGSQWVIPDLLRTTSSISVGRTC
jgi:hypothetical protein